jgi:hypothetical protein
MRGRGEYDRGGRLKGGCGQDCLPPRAAIGIGGLTIRRRLNNLPHMLRNEWVVVDEVSK